MPGALVIYWFFHPGIIKKKESFFLICGIAIASERKCVLV